MFCMPRARFTHSIHHTLSKTSPRFYSIQLLANLYTVMAYKVCKITIATTVIHKCPKRLVHKHVSQKCQYASIYPTIKAGRLHKHHDSIICLSATLSRLPWFMTHFLQLLWISPLDSLTKSPSHPLAPF